MYHDQSIACQPDFNPVRKGDAFQYLFEALFYLFKLSVLRHSPNYLKETARSLVQATVHRSPLDRLSEGLPRAL